MRIASLGCFFSFYLGMGVRLALLLFALALNVPGFAHGPENTHFDSVQWRHAYGELLDDLLLSANPNNVPASSPSPSTSPTSSAQFPEKSAGQASRQLPEIEIVTFKTLDQKRIIEMPVSKLKAIVALHWRTFFEAQKMRNQKGEGSFEPLLVSEIELEKEFEKAWASIFKRRTVLISNWVRDLLLETVVGLRRYGMSYVTLTIAFELIEHTFFHTPFCKLFQAGLIYVLDGLNLHLAFLSSGDLGKSYFNFIADYWMYKKNIQDLVKLNRDCLGQPNSCLGEMAANNIILALLVLVRFPFYQISARIVRYEQQEKY